MRTVTRVCRLKLTENGVLFLKNNIMRAKATQRKTGPDCKGKSRKHGEMSLKFHLAQPKPFVGKVFYLDLPSNKMTESLETDIQHLGGCVEKFFSKEIKYLVTNKREAKYIHCLKQDSQVPSPESECSSPFPGSHPFQPGHCGDHIKSRSQGQTDTVLISRGKSFVERAVRKKERVHISKILLNALEWGVKILYINDVIIYVEKKKTLASQCPRPTVVKSSVKPESTAKHTCQKHKGRIHKPFVKVEDSSRSEILASTFKYAFSFPKCCSHVIFRRYCPVYLTILNMAELNLKAPPPHSPFLFNDKDPKGDKLQGNRSVKTSTVEEQAAGQKKNKDKKRGGYCECCAVKYENLTMHLQSDRHRAFSKTDAYQVVDRLVSTLPCSFTRLNRLYKRPKCSISTALVVPAPLGRSGHGGKADQNPAGIMKEKQHNHALNVSSASPSASLIHCNDRKWFIASHQSKLQSRQKQLVSCSQKATHNAEMAPSSFEHLARSSLLVPRVNLDVQVSHRDPLSLALPPHQDPHSVSYLESPEVITNQDETTGNNGKASGKVSERDGASPPSLTYTSPVKKVKRKVKAYKRKRRKLNSKTTCKDHVVESDACDDTLRLWQLFYSSEDKGGIPGV
ncbi:protein DBF4 homolog A isoform X2 [Nerophis ophidion]|uniref:protein DBF4 homolog A isoform X2 n=1 Tax=Nerophis ophidion TaxID=159077 RepID=UPI002AE00216|nr:protein DBF4 homolog A isoform X2 [Nerophis ophidion]